MNVIWGRSKKMIDLQLPFLKNVSILLYILYCTVVFFSKLTNLFIRYRTRPFAKELLTINYNTDFLFRKYSDLYSVSRFF